MGRWGRYALYWDAGQNTVQVGRDSYDIYENGLNWTNGLQVGGGLLGLGGNYATWRRLPPGGTPATGAVAESSPPSRRSIQSWFAFWADRGGVTEINPLTNRRFFNSYNPIVHNFEVRGTVAYLDTAVHEGVHAFIGRRMPIIWDLGEARFFGIPVGAPVAYVEELVAYSFGHLATGRIHALPFVPIEALASLTPGQQAVVIVTGVGAGYIICQLD